MGTSNRYYLPGTTVSRYLSPNGRSWAGVVTQTGRPILDSELNLMQDAAYAQNAQLQASYMPSGWIRPQGSMQGLGDFVPVAAATATNVIDLRAGLAMVAGYPIQVEFANTTTAGLNRVVLSAPPSPVPPPFISRTDFAFLEVWLAVVAPSPRATGSVLVLPALPAPGDTVTINAVVLTAVAGAPGVGQFQIGANEITTAANLAGAINNPLNGLTTVVTADAGGTDTVVLTAVTPGAAGNAITLATTGAALTPSGPTLSGGADRPNKPSQSTIYRNGCVQAPAPVNLVDDIEDTLVGSETTERIQVQWRIRVTGTTENVNYQAQPFGFENANVVAQGATVAPVATYQFVPADGTTVAGPSSAAAYGQVDSGLWVAGDGSSGSATALGTADGFVYAIPLAMIFRRNDASGAGYTGFDPLNNTLGALPYGHGVFNNPVVPPQPPVFNIPANVSDRPDGYFCDVIVLDDVLDLRRSVMPTGVDMSSELVRQVQMLLDGKNRTWAINGADRSILGNGSGDISTRHLVCDQIGRTTAKGGVGPVSGDTPRGVTVRNLDHVARRFGAQPIVERFVIAIEPTFTAITHPGNYNLQVAPAHTTWAEGDEIHIDLDGLNATSLGSFDPVTNSWVAAAPTATVFDFAPIGTLITDVVSVYHDDGHSTVPVLQEVVPETITGLGSSHLVITLDTNTVTVNGGGSVANHPMVCVAAANNGSARRIFVEVEVTYPAGSGLTATPDVPLTPDPVVYPVGPVLENSVTQRPTDWQQLLPPRFREGHREVKMEYVANNGAGTAITDNIVSRSNTTLVFPRRVFGNVFYPVTVSDTVVSQAHNIDVPLTDYGSSSRLVTLTTGGGPADSPLSGDQVLCTITYYAQDPIPNYGAPGGGYQFGVYYRTVSVATAGVQPGAMAVVPNNPTFQLLALLDDVWSAIAGAGSTDVSFPYANPMDFIPVNDNGTLSFPGEWYFQGSGSVSVSDFEGDTGLVRLHSFVQVDGTEPLQLDLKTKDAEYRALYTAAATAGGYRPSTAAQPLSGVARHKAFTAALAKSTVDTTLYRKGEVVLLVFSEFLELSDRNTILFPTANSRSSVSVFRTANLLLVP